MLKINLLNSVTERQHGAVVAIDHKVGSPTSRLLLMSLVVGFLAVAISGWDIISSQMALTEANKNLEEQKQIAVQLEGVMKEQKDLETKIAAIDGRIVAIKKLRDEQRGPSAVLTAVRERLTMLPGLYLQSVVQKGDQLEIKGNSPDESVPTTFGRSLEFSNGLFSNLSIETQRSEVVNQLSAVPSGGEQAKVNVINFNIKTAYTPSKAVGGSANVTSVAGAPAQNSSSPVQVAKN